MTTRMFSTVALDDQSSTEELEHHLSGALDAQPAVFTLLWTRGLGVLISGLVYRRTGETKWVQLLTHQVLEDDGEFSLTFGPFKEGESIEVMVIALAVDADVPRAVGAVTTGGSVKQIIPTPPTPSEKMERGVSWIKKGEFRV
ncbi:MAG TPA: hypothetical protein VF092_18095 [Longimicrobium sp.]